MEQRHHAQEDVPDIHDRPSMEKTVPDRVADILRQRQNSGSPRIAADPDERIVPVDIAQPTAGNIAGTQGEQGKQQQHGVIPQSLRRRPVAGCDDVFDIVPRHETGQCREPLAGNRRHSSGKPGPAKALEAQIRPKEGPGGAAGASSRQGLGAAGYVRAMLHMSFAASGENSVECSWRPLRCF